MYLLPAIDILGGKAVRLAKGDYACVTTYNDDPVEQAKEFQREGATWLHVVDLDGAKTGESTNIEIIKRIVEETDLQVEVGGGVRSIEAIERLIDAGVARVVLGTALVRDPEFARQAVREYGDQLAAGIDAKSGEVAVEGWCEGSGVSAEDLAHSMARMGYRHLIYTDISRDGMQTGIDPQAYVSMARAFGNPVIASGGVASAADLEALGTPEVIDCVEGVIAGRAIYEGSMSVIEGVLTCKAVSDGFQPKEEN